MGDISHTTVPQDVAKKKSWLMNHWGQMDPHLKMMWLAVDLPSGKRG